MTSFAAYFGFLETHLHLELRKRSEVLDEVRSHVEQRAEELTRLGVPAAAAEEQALEDFGDPGQLASSFYRVHATASVRDTLLAMLPHLGLAAMFGLNLWVDLFWVLVAVASATLIGVLAWRRGLPKWAYPWMGYAVVLPAVTSMLAIVALAYGAWSYATGHGLPLPFSLYVVTALWVPFSLAIVIKVALRVVRDDWLVVSLAALPLPFFTAWVFLLHWRGGVLLPDRVRALETGTTTTMVFVALAVTTAIFMKISNRRWRVLVMLLPAAVLAATAAMRYQTAPGSLPILTAMLLTVAFLLSPILLDPVERAGIRRPRRHPSGPGNP